MENANGEIYEDNDVEDFSTGVVDNGGCGRAITFTAAGVLLGILVALWVWR